MFCSRWKYQTIVGIVSTNEVSFHIQLETYCRARLPPSVSAQTNAHQLTLPVTGYFLSPAERYIAARAQLVSNYEDLSPESPSSVSSFSTVTSGVNPVGSTSAHDQLMSQWHLRKSEEIRQKAKHRYVYGPRAPVEKVVQQGTRQRRLIDSIQSSPNVLPRTDDSPSSTSPVRSNPVNAPKNLSQWSSDVWDAMQFFLSIEHIFLFVVSLLIKQINDSHLYSSREWRNDMMCWTIDWISSLEICIICFSRWFTDEIDTKPLRLIEIKRKSPTFSFPDLVAGQHKYQYEWSSIFAIDDSGERIRACLWTATILLLDKTSKYIKKTKQFWKTDSIAFGCRWYCMSLLSGDRATSLLGRSRWLGVKALVTEKSTEIIESLHEIGELEVIVFGNEVRVISIVIWLVTVEKRIEVKSESTVVRLMEMSGTRCVEMLEEIVHVKLKGIGVRRRENVMTLRVILTAFAGIAEDIVGLRDRTKGVLRLGILVLIGVVFQRWREEGNWCDAGNVVLIPNCRNRRLISFSLASRLTPKIS